MRGESRRGEERGLGVGEEEEEVGAKEEGEGWSSEDTADSNHNSTTVSATTTSTTATSTATSTATYTTTTTTTTSLAARTTSALYAVLRSKSLGKLLQNSAPVLLTRVVKPDRTARIFLTVFSLCVALACWSTMIGGEVL